MIIYIYSKCSTCQKAVSFLKEKSVSFKVEEITQTPPTAAELEKMLTFQKGNLKKLLNTSGLLYREMNLTERLPRMPQEEIFQLLTQNGMLIKRPFLLGKNVGLTGFNEKSWSEQLNQANDSNEKS